MWVLYLLFCSHSSSPGCFGSLPSLLHPLSLALFSPAPDSQKKKIVMADYLTVKELAGPGQLTETPRAWGRCAEMCNTAAASCTHPWVLQKHILHCLAKRVNEVTCHVLTAFLNCYTMHIASQQTNTASFCYVLLAHQGHVQRPHTHIWEADILHALRPKYGHF